MKPFLFCPGLFVSGTNAYLHWCRLTEYCKVLGRQIIIVNLPNHMTLEEKAQTLIQMIELHPPDQQGPFDVLGHSAGGWVAKIAATRRPDLFRCIVTVGTPHAGAPLAEDIMQMNDPIAKLVFESIFGVAPKKIVYEMTKAFADEWNASNEFPSEVKAYCLPHVIDARWKCDPLAKRNFDLMKERGIHNSDGTVPLLSQLWGTPLPTQHGSHVAQMAPTRYGLPWQSIWRNTLKQAFTVFA